VASRGDSRAIVTAALPAAGISPATPAAASGFVRVERRTMSTGAATRTGGEASSCDLIARADAATCGAEEGAR
jgi:hypothetical protein